MSIRAIIERLKEGSISEREFVNKLREGMNAILDGIEDECYNRADALSELEDSLQDQGLLQHSTEHLLARVQALEGEKTVLQDEVEAWRLTAAATQTALDAARQNGTSSSLSNKRKKALAKMINASIARGNDAYRYFIARHNATMADGDTDKARTNLFDVEQNSTELKQALNNLSDAVNESCKGVAAQHLRTAMRCWGDVHRGIVPEREDAPKMFMTRDMASFRIYAEDSGLVGELIADLREIAQVLGLDMQRVTQDVTL